MATSIYVGNLPFSVTESEISDLFSQYGKIESIKLIIDHHTGRPRGFGFVEMEDNEASAAIEALNGQEFGGRILRVNKARPRR